MLFLSFSSHILWKTIKNINKGMDWNRWICTKCCEFALLCDYDIFKATIYASSITYLYDSFINLTRTITFMTVIVIGFIKIFNLTSYFFVFLIIISSLITTWFDVFTSSSTFVLKINVWKILSPLCETSISEQNDCKRQSSILSPLSSNKKM